jgi:thiol-disulfide isomerase/thioredoxin
MKLRLSPKWLVIAVALALFKVWWGHAPLGSGSVGAQTLSGPAPELVVHTPAGRERRLAELHGQPVLVHFWATWCEPCREELPSLLEYADSPTTLPVLAVSVDNDWATVRKFFDGPVPPSVVLVDQGNSKATCGGGACPMLTQQGFGITGVPESFVIDANGQLRARFAGPRDWSSEDVREAVMKLATGK